MASLFSVRAAKLVIFTAKSLLSQELRPGLWTASNGMAEVKVSDTKARQRTRAEYFPGNIFGPENKVLIC